MNEDLENLVVLQAQDLELARLRAELAAIPRRISLAEAEVTQARATLSSSGTRLLAEQKLGREQERDLLSLRSRLDRQRRSLDTATSAQQVGAFEHEIAFTVASIHQLEEDSFTSLERLEALEAEQGTATETVAAAERALHNTRERADALTLSHEAAITGIERERASLRADVRPAHLATYDKLARTRGTGVAEALGNATSGKCAACQMSVRPQRWQDLISREHSADIFLCESCGRILFWDPRRDTPGSWAAGERLAAASASASAFSAAPARGSR